MATASGCAELVIDGVIAAHCHAEHSYCLDGCDARFKYGDPGRALCHEDCDYDLDYCLDTLELDDDDPMDGPDALASFPADEPDPEDEDDADDLDDEDETFDLAADSDTRPDSAGRFEQ